MSSIIGIVSRIWASAAGPTLPRAETIRPVILPEGACVPEARNLAAARGLQERPGRAIGGSACLETTAPDERPTVAMARRPRWRNAEDQPP
jgi:hypothetical protein